MKTKLKAPKLAEISLDDYKKEFIRLMKMAPQKCANREQALWFFIKQNHEFPDGTVHPLILLSTPSMPWEIFAKATVKSDKKYCLLGKAYYQQLSNGKGSLQIEVEKGAAKMDKVTKAARGLLNKTGIELMLATVPPPTEKLPEKEEETIKANPEATIEQRKEKAKATFSTFSSLMKKLGVEV